ncbi:hypothetical protein U1Q18_016876 [Sarracenia purpurea var. burkii]
MYLKKSLAVSIAETYLGAGTKIAVSIRCSILAVRGRKSGKISFWRILEPQCFPVTSNRDSTAVFLVGLLQAHSAWITAIGWAFFASDASDSQILLATRSSDGRVSLAIGKMELQHPNLCQSTLSDQALFFSFSIGFDEPILPMQIMRIDSIFYDNLASKPEIAGRFGSGTVFVKK